MSAPKKSNAFLITFILVLLLLLIGYWLFTNKDKVFKTGGLNLGRIFEPLVESPDRKPLEVIWDRIFNPGENTNKTDPNAFVYDPNNNIHNFPVIKLSASPSSVREGESAIINWTSTNSASCESDNGAQVGTSGSFSTGPLSKSKSFTVRCRGNNGTINSSIVVKVGDRKIDPYNFPSVSGNADPSPIEVGNSSTISWESNNAKSCNSGVGNPTTTSGNFSTGPLYTTTSYSIVCTGDDGTSGRNIFVIVKSDIGLEYDQCDNGTDNYPTCTTLNGQCKNGAKNPDLCTISADGKCINGATNPEACNKFDHPFCAANKITKQMAQGLTSNDKEQVKSLQTILSKLFSPSLNKTYLTASNIDGNFGAGTRFAVATFQKDNNLNVNKRMGTVDKETMDAINNKCNELFSNNNSLVFQCGDGLDNDSKEGPDSSDPSCHSDFNANNSTSYDKNIKDEGRIKINAQCGDGENNDKEEGPDYLDKDCHTDGNVNNWESYHKDIATEKGGLPIPAETCGNKAINWPTCNDFGNGTKEQCNPPAVNWPQCNKDKDGNCLNGSKNATCTPENITINKCMWLDQFSLEFTDSEKAKLAELLRKFYLLAPTLKTEDDLSLVYNEIDNYKGFIKQIEGLTNKCEVEKSSLYLGPTTTFGNPWYKYDERGSYTSGYSNYVYTPKYDQVIAGENLVKNDPVYISDVSSSKINIVKKYYTGIPPICGGSLGLCFPAIITGYAVTDIANGATGQIFLPDYSPGSLEKINENLDSLSASLNFWNNEVDLNNKTLVKTLLSEFETLLNIW